MEAASLDDFMAWNDELYALAQAGVPIDIDLGREGASAVAALERINATVARRVSQGASLAEAVRGDSRVLTPAYGSLVQTGLTSGSLAAALNGPNRLAESLDNLWHAMRLSLLYPLLVGGLAYLGLVGFCLFYVPAIEELHDELRLLQGPGLKALTAVKETLPYWVAIPPLAILALAIVQMLFAWRRRLSRRSAERLLRWLPGMSRSIDEQRWANFAETAGALLAAGASEEEALRLTGEATGVAALTANENLQRAANNDNERSAGMPPFLRYALWRSEPSVGRVRALQMAAELYRASARRRADRVRFAAPLVLTATVGGSITLLYGLALFLPVVELLWSLAS